ncbi:MAG: lysine--tRNA ligase [Sphaerochaetaceae bacterium]
MNEQNVSMHWADIYADKIIREKGDKELYTCASGITPSGTVHIGNFREIISVDLVVRALRERGKKVRFIYSWDDYDVFRKVPKNMPQPELLEKYLRYPITMVPDTSGRADNYAHANELDVEKILPTVGIHPEYLYQAERYCHSMYAEGMRTALEHRSEIKAILDKYRTEPLPDTWFPISVFSSFTDKDNTTVLDWDGQWAVTYHDDDLDKTETIDLRTTSYAKLPWRIDWPMRWSREHVDFEPAGKDHHSEGGSFDTSKEIVELFGWHAPVSFQYDFISIKGHGGKISSSSGDVISLYDVLEIYTPEITRYMFAGTRPNTEFSISFDLDVLKMYEDYDNCERIYFGVLPVNEKRRAKEKRIFELSQVNEVPKTISYQIPFRHLCNLLQIHEGDIDAVIASLRNIHPDQKERLVARAQCAWNWISKFAPEEFRFHLASANDGKIPLEGNLLKSVQSLASVVDTMEKLSSDEFSTAMYACAEDNGVEVGDFFTTVYQVLIGKEKGPKLADFIQSCGKTKVSRILARYQA